MNPRPKSTFRSVYARSLLLFNDDCHSKRQPTSIIALPVYDRGTNSVSHERDRTYDSCDQNSLVLMSFAEGHPPSEEGNSVNAAQVRGA